MSKRGRPQVEKGIEIAREQCKALWGAADYHGIIHRDKAAQVLGIKRASLYRMYSKLQRYNLVLPTLIPKMKGQYTTKTDDSNLPDRVSITNDPFGLKHFKIRYITETGEPSNRDEGANWITMLR